MKFDVIECLCSNRCGKYLVRPLFFSQDVALPKTQADEVARRWNHFEDVEAVAKLNRNTVEAQQRVYTEHIEKLETRIRELDEHSRSRRVNRLKKRGKVQWSGR